MNTFKLFAIRYDLRRNLRHREDVVHQTRGQRVARHVVVLSLFRSLHDTETAHLLNPLHAHRAIRARAGEHDRDRALTVGLSERAEEDVDGSAPDLAARHVGDFDVSFFKLQTLIRWNNVNVIGFDANASFDLGDRKHSRILEHLRQLAVVIRRKVQNHNVGHSGLGRNMREEIPQRPYATRRSAEAYY